MMQLAEIKNFIELFQKLALGILPFFLLLEGVGIVILLELFSVKLLLKKSRGEVPYCRIFNLQMIIGSPYIFQNIMFHGSN